MKRTVKAALVSTLIFTFGFGSACVPADEAWNNGDAAITSEIDSLSIDWSSGQVDIRYGEGDGILVETTPSDLADKEKAQWRVDGTKLRIRQRGGFRLFHFGRSSKKSLTVTVPKDSRMKELSIDVSSGEVYSELNTEKLDAECSSGSYEIILTEPVEEMRLEGSSGEFQVTAPKAEDLRLGLSSGSADLLVTDVGSLKVDVSSGIVRTAVSTVSKGSFELSSGSLDLWLPADTGFTADVDKASGSFTSDLAVKMDGKKYVCGDGSAELEFDLASGTVKIHETTDAANPSFE